MSQDARLAALSALMEGRPVEPFDGEIYFIQAGPAGPVKIGYVYKTSTRRRLETLQTAHYLELRLLMTLPGSIADEQLLHREFTTLRIRGEWFRFEEPLVSFLRTRCS